MKAAILENIESLKIIDVKIPYCEKNEILIKVNACAICGTDVKVYHHGHKHIVFPRITGHEVSGEIFETGMLVKDFKKGDSVAIAPALPCGECRYCREGMMSMCDNLTAIGYHYDGGFAEFMLVPEIAIKSGCVNKIPKNISFEEACLAEPLACAINGQELSGVKLGHTVLIMGAGPLGCIHAQLARTKGATKIIMADISNERLEMAKIAQADFYINISQENLKQKIYEITNERGADVVIVSCASKKAQEQSLEVVAKRGNINFFGGLPKTDSIINFDSNLPHYKEFYVVGTHGSAPHHNRLALDLISSNLIKVKDLITHQFPIEKLKDGLDIVEKGNGLKVIIKN
ncbi:MAG: zinc-dependent dehydrogenase [bacterium]